METDLNDIMLSRASWRPIGLTATSNDIPEKVSLQQLFTNGRLHYASINISAHGKTLTVRGTVKNISQDADGSRRLLLADDDHTILVICGPDAQGNPPPEEGWRIAVTGVCVKDSDVWRPTVPIPKIRGLFLVTRSDGDIVVLRKTPWWTPARLAALAGLLFAVLVGFGIWNLSLKRKSERRGRDLYQERIGHALAEQKVEERTRLAVELHDSVSQTLTGVALQLDGGEIETAKTMLASCRGELRRCLWDLRSRTFEEKDMTEAVTRTITPHLNGITATVRFNVPRERLSESLTHAILRIIRELVVNAIRHGRANHVKIAGEMHESTVSFSVSDDGCGFDPNAAPGPELGHFGLLGIRERIEDFNGGLKIASAPNQGAKFTVTLTTTDEANER